MKELWLETTKQKKTLYESLVNQYVDVVIEDDKAEFLANKQTLNVVTPSNEAALEKNKAAKVLRICISDKASENLIVKAAEQGATHILVSTANWRVIPLENLIARIKGKSKLIAEVTNAEEAKVALETLELGTDGVLLKTSDADEILKTVAIVKPDALKLEMVPAKIVATKPISTGARVCVDTCDLMQPGEGMLVGSQSAGLFLVEAEVNENPYVASRPFRVNAGSCSMYTLGNLQTTRYLQEFKAGDEVITRQPRRQNPQSQRGQNKNRNPTANPSRSRGRRKNHQNHPPERRNHPRRHPQSLQTSHRTKTRRRSHGTFSSKGRQTLRHFCAG